MKKFESYKTLKNDARDRLVELHLIGEHALRENRPVEAARCLEAMFVCATTYQLRDEQLAILGDLAVLAEPQESERLLAIGEQLSDQLDSSRMSANLSPAVSEVA